MSDNLPNLMTPKELMEYLNCGKRTAYTLCAKRDFPSFRVGNNYYILKDKLAQWIERESTKIKF